MSEAKRQAALKAIEYVQHDSIIGVGTGSTVAYFIEALGEMRDHIRGAVSSSEQSTARLRAVGRCSARCSKPRRGCDPESPRAPR